MAYKQREADWKQSGITDSIPSQERLLMAAHERAETTCEQRAEAAQLRDAGFPSLPLIPVLQFCGCAPPRVKQRKRISWGINWTYSYEAQDIPQKNSLWFRETELCTRSHNITVITTYIIALHYIYALLTLFGHQVYELVQRDCTEIKFTTCSYYCAVPKRSEVLSSL